jgi:hypothetical protein
MSAFAGFRFRASLAGAVALAAMTILLAVLPAAVLNRRLSKFSSF